MSDYFFEIVASSDLQCLRELQVNELRGTAQDGTEEGILTYNADFVRIANNKELIGYACIGTYGIYKDMILEFYIICKYRIDSAEIIKQVINTYKCKKWLVNTQDFFAFPLILDLQLKYDIDAYKFAFADSTGIEFNIRQEITIEVTTLEEINEVYPLVMQDRFYTGGDISSLYPTIFDNEMYSMRKNGRLIGVGFISVSKRTPRYADIAMIIDREYRQNGYGVFLVRTLVAKCRLLNLIPTAVCDVSNIASRMSLEKAGFHLDGCLLLVKVDDIDITL